MDPKLDPVPKPKPSKPRTRKAAKMSESELRAKLEDDFTSMGALWALMDPVCGTLVARRGPAVANTWARYAMENDKFYNMVAGMGKTTGLAAVVISTGGLLLGIAAHHGMAPEGLAGMAVPEYAEIVAEVEAMEAQWPEQGPPPRSETDIQQTDSSEESSGNKDNTQP